MHNLRCLWYAFAVSMSCVVVAQSSGLAIAAPPNERSRIRSSSVAFVADETEPPHFSFSDDYFSNMPGPQWNAMRGDIHGLKAYLDLEGSGYTVDSKDQYDCTALTWAVAYGQVRMVNELLALGADINASIVRLLPMAAYTGNAEIVRLLIDAGANVNQDTDTNGRYTSDIEINALEVLSFRNTGFVNMCGTPLSIAAARGDLDIIQMLLDAGADVDLPSLIEGTPLMLAVIYGQYDAMLLLIQAGADVNCSDTVLGTPLHKAAEFNDIPMMQLLLDNGAETEVHGFLGWTPLHEAAYYGEIAAVQMLLDYGADVEALDNKHHSPLYWALYEGSQRRDPRPNSCDTVATILRAHGGQ